MENNEISMIMDIKLDVHDKIKFKQWTRCQVKIEAVKCLPCFLRVSITPKALLEDPDAVEPKSTNISINVPGVTISLASSRTRDHSYGMFWKQSRRNCFIYFALETDTRCRRLMKWIKKSIKNLELHRQIVLEQRRCSRGNFPPRNVPKHLLPPQEVNEFDSTSSYTSGIYEEIFDGEETNVQICKRNKSRVSIASGIYEEMKPFNPSLNSKSKEIKNEVAPPLPPLPPHRKRINTFENEIVGQLGIIPRSNTNPESEAIKKKKYKNMFDNIFGVSRSKRAESVSETQACSIEDIINCPTPQKTTGIDSTTKHKEIMRKKEKRLNVKEKRNSFSSPDLSKINFMQYHDNDEVDEKSTNIGNKPLSITRDCNTFLTPTKTKSRTDSLDSLNISSQIPNNFNFSACNNSKINLVGAHGAVLGENMSNYRYNKIQIDELSGYCVMAPININTETVRQDVVSASNIEIHLEHISQNTSSTNKTEESAIYINMNNSSSASASPLTGQHFSHNLYENLLTVKAAQELETLSVEQCAKQMSTSTPTECVINSSKLDNCQKTAEEENFYQTPRKSIISVDEKISSYYPNNVSDYIKNRRSSRSPLKDRINSVEKTDKDTEIKKVEEIEKPCSTKKSSKSHRDSNKMKEMKPCKLPAKRTTVNGATGAKLPHKIKTAAVQKISDNVYAVARSGKIVINNDNNNNNNNNVNENKEKVIEIDAYEIENEKIPRELKHLTVLPKIDFKFDDVRSLVLQEVNEENGTLLRSATTTTKSVALVRKIRAASHTPQKQSYEGIVGSVKKSHTPPINTTTTTNTDVREDVGYAGQLLQLSAMKKFASLPRLKKFDFSPLKLKINNVLQRHQQQQPFTATTLPVSELQK